MEIFRLNKNNIAEVATRAAKILRSGGLVVYPTDTVYGLGVDVTNEMAVEKLWKFKGGRENKPVLMAVNGELMAGKYIKINDLGKKIMRKYWPGSVSVVGVSKNKVAEKVQSEKGTLGVRMPDNDFVLKLVDLLKKPITSTSANVSGGKTCRSLEEFMAEVPEDRKQLVDCFVDGGMIEGKLPSTIVDVSEGEMKIVRQGEVEIDV